MRFSVLRPESAAALALVVLFGTATAQQEKHGRGYKAPPPTATVTVTVEKAANNKPLPNASVIFRATRDGDNEGNLEMKTDPDGHATLDLLSVGSHVTVQVIAGGFATYAADFELAPDGKQLLVKLERPRAQVSMYGDDRDRPAESKPGIQEHGRAQPTAPTSVPPVTPSPTTPLQVTPPVSTPGSAPQNTTTPEKPGTPQ